MILVISYDEDHTLDVISRLEAAGREVARFDLADFPAHGVINFDSSDGNQPDCTLTTPTGHASLAGCRVAWWRRMRPFSVDPTLRTARDQGFAASETSQALHGMFHALNCTWINPPSLDAVAHHKPYQWETARRVGLALPRTLVTNQPERARRFIQDVGVGRTVFKCFLAQAEAWRETRLVRREDLAQLDAVRYAPVIFQEFVPGADLRVTVVGERVFAAEIDASATSYPVDMRTVVNEARVRPVTLPPALTDTLLRFMSRLGLVYGAIDLRRRPDGQYVFFEVNPAGQWLFVEHRAGLPISEELAALLARLDAPGHAHDRERATTSQSLVGRAA
ncbi:MvdC/MvdD family ATP grasp protein [Streptomyces sp. NPDC001739]|uniref:MvdC/MvdD family ATP grasp protein n=1 Tax=Streptomyces sp. NPDC001633 TaxID=3364595 RepID=UPI00368AD1E2